MQNELQINIEEKNDDILVHMTGDATITDIDTMRETLTPLHNTQPPFKRIILNLEELVFINSLGLGVLLELRKEMLERNIDLCLAAVSNKVHTVLKKTHLTEIFPTYDSADQALTQ